MFRALGLDANDQLIRFAIFLKGTSLEICCGHFELVVGLIKENLAELQKILSSDDKTCFVNCLEITEKLAMMS